MMSIYPKPVSVKRVSLFFFLITLKVLILNECWREKKIDYEISYIVELVKNLTDDYPCCKIVENFYKESAI